MSWNYENKLIEYIAQAQRDSGLKDENGNDYIFEVCTEEIFVKKSTLSPSTIYVVIKYLSTTNTLNAVTQPIQLIVMCEQNQIQASQIIFSKLVASHNFETIIDGGTYVKQDYREPVVLSNFNEVSYGYRTIMYISATLFIMDGVVDVSNLNIKLEIMEDLTAFDITTRNSCFESGISFIQSPYFVINASAIKKIIADNAISNVGIRYYEGSNGLLRVLDENYEEYECDEIVFYSNRYTTSLNNTILKTVYYDYINNIFVKFMPGSGSRVFQKIGTNSNYALVFPSIVNKKLSQSTNDDVKPINFNIAYSMTPNTQPIPPQRIATSVKSLATFSITFNVPMISDYDFINVISNIMRGAVSGNLDFIVSFTLGNVQFNNVNMKLISTQITTAINEIPGLQIGLLR